MAARRASHIWTFVLITLAACDARERPNPDAPPTMPPSEDSAVARLAASTRHGEWVMVQLPASEGRAADSLRAWVVYPERATRAPVVLVIHEIFGLTTWVRSVTDQLAADGFIAIAPDLLSGKRLPASPDSLATIAGGLDSAVAVISGLDYGQVVRRIEAVGRYGAALPAALPKWGVIGFCWGGSMSFTTAAYIPAASAAVVFYGAATPDRIDFKGVQTPTLALMAENDARVNVTLPYADSSYRAAGVMYEQSILKGAGHGFMREQDAHDGANLAAARAAWPRMISFLRTHLEP
jgi:carboxymethylenebutenolidase